MKRKGFMRVTSVLLALLLLGVTAAGCGAKTETSGEATVASTTAAQEQTTDAAASGSEDPLAEKVPIRFVRAGNEQDPTKDRILLKLQELMNIDLEIVSIPWDQFPNKLNIMMASGEKIDMANCEAGKTLNEWAQNGLVLSYDEYLKDGKYPNVAAVVNSELYKGLKVDGKVYYKPLGLCPQQWGMLIRQDWLDNLGLKIPTNISEFYEVLKAFQNGDPDKNGKKDTYGMYVRDGGEVDPFGGSQLFAYIGRAYAINAGINNWVTLTDGSITRYEVSDSAKQAAQFIAKAINDGLINKDWLTLKRDSAQGPESDDFAAGKYGITATSVPDVFMQKLAAVNPNAKVSYLAPLNGENGVQANSGTAGGYWWGTVIPATSKNPERVLALLDYCLTAEGRELTEYGIKGIHFTDYSDNGKGGRIYNIVKEECDKDWDTAKNGYLYPLAWGGFNYYEYAYIPIEENSYDYDKAFNNAQAWQPADMANGQFADWQTKNTSYSISSPLINVMDDKILGDQTKLKSIWGEGWLKAVVKYDNFDKEWNDMVSKWLAAGGKEIVEYGNEYNKNNK